MNRTLARYINQLAKEDKKERAGHHKGSKIKNDKKRIRELKKLIQQHGWPTVSLVGKKASTNAWLLVQHADHDLKFQKYILNLLEEIDKANRNDIDRANIAYLKDRILMAEKKKQLFGTQFRFDKQGRLSLYPIKNLKGIGSLRKAYKLPPLKEFIKAADEFNQGLKKKD